MGRKLVFAMLLGLLLLSLTAPLFAQGEAGAATAKAPKSQWLVLTSGFAMAIAAAGCGIAQSRALAGACLGVSRNPAATDTIRIFVFIGLAFIEFLALLTFVIVILLNYV